MSITNNHNYRNSFYDDSIIQNIVIKDKMSAKADFDHILKKLGWVDGFDIPIANAENQALQFQIAELIKRKAKAITNLETVSSKFEALQKHLKHVNHEHEEQQVSN